jgi:hypothetical protein
MIQPQNAVAKYKWNGSATTIESYGHRHVGDTVEITLSSGDITLVDAADFSAIRELRYGWVIARRRGVNYAIRFDYKEGVRYGIQMHRLIMQPPRHLVVDHINGNGLDNRRANLRVCTQAENLRNRHTTSNRSGFKGVTAVMGGFKAEIRTQVKRIYLGYFKTAEEAAHAYNEAAQTYHGEFARLNVIPAA